MTDHLKLAAEVSGLALVIAGLVMIYLPAAIIAGGLVLVAAGNVERR